MKIIALLPVKNEEWILPTYLSSIKQITPHIIAFDDGSTDRSKEMLLAANAVVLTERTWQKTDFFEQYHIRTHLLEMGRKAGGTHFILLDADECFDARFIEHAEEILPTLEPGQALELPWITLWKDERQHRTDGVFQNLTKCFVYADDGVSVYPQGGLHLHFGNIPMTTKEQRRSPEGGVLHFQYVDYPRTQAKQAWYMAAELLKQERSVRRINASYLITKDGPHVRTTPLTKSSYTGITLPTTRDTQARQRYLDKLFAWFQEYGIAHFERLDIWEIEELHEAFVEQMHREPKPNTFPSWLIQLNSLRHKIRAWLTHLF